MRVVVVESPAKAKTINKYLGPGYEVVASFGHIRDLPAKDGSVDPDADFRMLWDVEPKAAKRLADIARAVKGAERLILATDPDREGEAISWHVLEVLKEKRALKDVAVERVTFNAITKQAVQDAMKHPRQIDQALVDAYLARRALDYLVGFTLSPVLWRKLPGARSAGRVQSVALRLVCDRELEIERFRSQEYWAIAVRLETPRGDVFEARLVGADGTKLGRLDIADGVSAEALTQALKAGAYRVTSVEAKPVKRHPWPPFTTSTLQQEASRKLGFAPARTMQLAQRLYEGVEIAGETVGLITYMRTDGVQIADEAIAAARQVIGSEFGERYVPRAPRVYRTKAKNAQEAHEAIRPTDMARHPSSVARRLEPDQARLYELVWKRTIASQMESAEIERTTVDIVAAADGRKLDLRAVGSVVKFDGFLKLYQEDRDDDGDDDDSRRLPAVSTGEALGCRGVEATQHFTEPPPRYSEASLVKRMEELGIGRPSTYAAILAVLRERGYVRLDKKRLHPEDKGRLVTGFLESFFSRYVEYDFTASLEEQLDRISNAELDWREVLRQFWQDFSAAVGGTKELRVSEVIDTLDEMLGPHFFPDLGDGIDRRRCPGCGDGRLSLKLGKYGSFIGCSNYPECKYTRPLAVPGNGDGTAEGDGPRSLGEDPDTGLDVTVRNGRFGPYVQLGDGEKPKRSSFPKGFDPATVDLDTALALLALPRAVATHPESGKPILVGIGRFGPYVQHDKTYANLGADDDVLSIGANRAIDLIVVKETRGPGRGRTADAGRALGDHPALGGPVSVRAGRYGPYVNHGKVNATLPKDVTPDSVTLAQAVELLKARAEKLEADGPKPKRAKAAPKAKAPAKTETDDAAPKAKTPKAAAKTAKATKPKAAPKSKTAAKATAKAPEKTTAKAKAKTATDTGA
ncbi:type I DNA topoisomerase [Blastochloris viridis]|uniref:DNA topoisomerase 1 n=1 Tax=Blastochloris viridis TaxID=1079 RepID=A0A0H5BHQ1_BLAVI|nr:type I DNA topoisomerase [Blastochloris viridis]ALK09439.1 DNA topoisomerase 1 [Blastochloris viridis]BAS00680.1 DNA topoisomerase I [Blastochloris viridis]CUU42102.1 DNA topoisomerase 1 [Blastochloris viridis]